MMREAIRNHECRGKAARRSAGFSFNESPNKADKHVESCDRKQYFLFTGECEVSWSTNLELGLQKPMSGMISEVESHNSLPGPFGLGLLEKV